MPPLTLGDPHPFWMPLIVEHCDDQAEPAAMRFDLQVLDVGRKAWQQLMVKLDEVVADATTSEQEQEEAVAALLLRVILDWRHVQDEHGNPLSFTPEGFRRLLDIQGMALAIVQAYDNSCPRAMPGGAES
ncbi:hypothetical protein [Halomonas sp. JS92-SW72]|uniref:hypothetical protein n=1 Tax=Halomonas sp. JS92-SW72 TaxID=2306583 RepID=UPI000E5A7AC9|nr:hypothetical protein [Halomonas sp. JS92-SW72]AXY41596.1 hypothetical protein D1793_04950 [Halomonas sp. JS92-SW72]